MIIVFSGCGNTAAAACELARISGDEVLTLTPDMLRSDAGMPEVEASGRHIVWAFPTYSWGVPPVVRRFISRVVLHRGEQLPHVMLTTCGDDIGDCATMWRRDIWQRGWKAGRAFSVQMPNTYVAMRGFDVDSTETAAEKLEAMPARVAYIAAEMDREGDDCVVRGSMAWLKTHVVYPWFVRMDMSPKPFHHTAECTGCGACARRCPMANISPDSSGRPQWGSECAMCMGCYHVCPSHAVAYGRTTRGKGQYRGPRATQKM